MPPSGSFSSSSPSSPTSPLPPPPASIASPCAACKILRRRCVKHCVLAPYFPPTDPQKFITAHRLFGASNIIKLLQELPESQRADAVSSLVYEANARSRDPVYGCAGAIFQLQKQLSELQSQLAMAQAEILSMQMQQTNMVALLCKQFHKQVIHFQTNSPNTYQLQFHRGNFRSFDDTTAAAQLAFLRT